MKNQIKLQIRTAKKAFRDGVKGATRKKIKDAMIDNMKSKVEEKSQNLYVAYSLSESETLIDHYLKKFEKGDTGWDKANKVIQDIDPTGIAKAIDGSTGAEVDDANKQVANWLNVISFVDPTGITGAVAGFIQHSHCEGTIKKMKAKVDAPISVDFQTGGVGNNLPSGIVHLKSVTDGTFLGMCGGKSDCESSSYGVYGFGSKESRTKWQVEQAGDGHVYLKQPDHGAWLGMCGHYYGCDGSVFGLRGYTSKVTRTRWIVEQSGDDLYFKQPDHTTGPYLGSCGCGWGNCGDSRHQIRSYNSKKSRTRFWFVNP